MSSVDDGSLTVEEHSRVGLTKYSIGCTLHLHSAIAQVTSQDAEGLGCLRHCVQATCKLIQKQ